jgi:hypothetical protein
MTLSQLVLGYIKVSSDNSAHFSFEILFPMSDPAATKMQVWRELLSTMPVGYL